MKQKKQNGARSRSTKQEHLLEELAVVQVQTLSITPILLLLLLLNLTPYNQSLKTIHYSSQELVHLLANLFSHPIETSLSKLKGANVRQEKTRFGKRSISEECETTRAALYTVCTGAVTHH